MIVAVRQFKEPIVDLKVVGDWVVVGLKTEILVFFFDSPGGLNDELKYSTGLFIPETKLTKRGLMDVVVSPQGDALVVYPDKKNANFLSVSVFEKSSKQV